LRKATKWSDEELEDVLRQQDMHRLLELVQCCDALLIDALAGKHVLITHIIDIGWLVGFRKRVGE